MATEIKLVHINGAISEIETNQNNKIVYKLSEPLILEEGDIVSLYQSFINVRGISDSTMLFDQDQEIIMRFYYWVPANKRTGFEIDDTLTHDNKFLYSEFESYPATPFNWIQEHMLQEDERYENYDERILGPNNTPCILCDVMEPNNSLGLPTGTVIPRIGQKSIYIPKGTYSVDTLTKLFSDQCNGIRTQAQNINKPYFDFEKDLALQDEWFMSKYIDQGDTTRTPQIDGFTTQITVYTNTLPLVIPYEEVTPPVVSAAGKQDVEVFFTSDPLNLGRDGLTIKRLRGNIFLTGNTWAYLKNQWSLGNLPTVQDMVELTENTNWAKGPPTDYLTFWYRIRVDPKEAFNTDNTYDGQIVRYETPGIVGASEFILQYSGDVVNRFSFSNLHTPLKQPSHLSQTTVNPLAGNQMTSITSSILQIEDAPTAGIRGFYPLDCSSGIAVISFNFKDVIQNSSSWQSIQNTVNNQLWNTPEAIQDQYKFYFNRHDEWFQPIIDADPAKLWLKSFWYRLGFVYSQIGTITPNLNRFSAYLSQKNQWTMPGFTTNNEYNLAMGLSASGLGQSLNMGNGQAYQQFGTVGIFVPSIATTGDTAPTSNQFNIYNLEATSKFYNALNFPDLLGGKNYMIIHSNLIPNNYKSASYDGGSIIGIASFEFSQLDTVFGMDEIPFNIIQSKVLHQIFLRLTWPDGTDIENEIMGAESGFILKIIKPVMLPGSSQAQPPKK
jgi:hypothetical protein